MVRSCLFQSLISISNIEADSRDVEDPCLFPDFVSPVKSLSLSTYGMETLHSAAHINM